jgi:hypothetical protein
MISSWYACFLGFCFPFGSKYSFSYEVTKRKERAIIQKSILKRANIILLKNLMTKCNKIIYLIFLGYSFKNFTKVLNNGKKKKKK